MADQARWQQAVATAGFDFVASLVRSLGPGVSIPKLRIETLVMYDGDVYRTEYGSRSAAASAVLDDGLTVEERKRAERVGLDLRFSTVKNAKELRQRVAAGELPNSSMHNPHAPPSPLFEDEARRRRKSA